MQLWPRFMCFLSGFFAAVHPSGVGTSRILRIFCTGKIGHVEEQAEPASFLRDVSYRPKSDYREWSLMKEYSMLVQSYVRFSSLHMVTLIFRLYTWRMVLEDSRWGYNFLCIHSY